MAAKQDAGEKDAAFIAEGGQKGQKHGHQIVFPVKALVELSGDIAGDQAQKGIVADGRAKKEVL